MQYVVIGATSETGKPVTITVEARDFRDAEEQARELGILVHRVHEATASRHDEVVRYVIHGVDHEAGKRSPPIELEATNEAAAIAKAKAMEVHPTSVDVRARRSVQGGRASKAPADRC